MLFFLMLFPKVMKIPLENMTLGVPVSGAPKPVGTWGDQPLSQGISHLKMK